MVVYTMGVGMVVLMRLLRLHERILVRRIQTQEVLAVVQASAAGLAAVELTWTAAGTLQACRVIGPGPISVRPSSAHALAGR
ncbi:hypothetical protein [Nocardiopsis aegyptia]|uniref:Uncharacterized protein n=1 Tax=Nocardiopsis aegyptia TaxID=220378 RepID=A0A7Z0J884_9ACTN|nr:hypothetical protein [Nocardiopsis aegyptia]NYJ32838.1 hypothetical protein [Nocardiopsis aegyptia]